MLFGARHNHPSFGTATLRDISGCYYTTDTFSPEGHRHYLPQVALKSNATLYPLYSITDLSQTFINPTSETIKEVRYIFPLYDGVAITSFVCTIGKVSFRGQVEQKDQARKTFGTAINQNQSAGLLESLPFGLFAATVGNIQAHQEVVINITYAGELKHDAGVNGVRYTLPTSICPRYGAYPGVLLKSHNAITKSSLEIVVDIDMEGCAIRKVQSPSKDHPISVTIGSLHNDPGETESQSSKASVTLTRNTAELSSDFVLQVLIDDLDAPRATLERHPSLPNSRALIATFVPRFDMPTYRPEVVFVADQSGSMQGDNNTALVLALVTFLKSLPLGVRFNICAFGTEHTLLWEHSRLYSSEDAEEALAFVNNFDAGMGGTEMIPAVKEVFDRRQEDTPLEVILLTDGQITGEDELMKLIRQRANERAGARVFTLGIGQDCSYTLVERAARAGYGFSQFVTDGEAMDQKIVRMLKAALRPRISDLTIEPQYSESTVDDFELVEREIEVPETESGIGSHVDEGATKPMPKSMFDSSVDADASIGSSAEDRYNYDQARPEPAILQAPGTRSPYFMFNRTTVYLLIEDGQDRSFTSVILRAKSPHGPLELVIPIRGISRGSTIHHLAARCLIKELEEGRDSFETMFVDGMPVLQHPRADRMFERKAVRLGLKYQVPNKWCSMVAVEERESAPAGKDNNVIKDRNQRFTLEVTPEHNPVVRIGLTPSRERTSFPFRSRASSALFSPGATMAMPQTRSALFSVGGNTLQSPARQLSFGPKMFVASSRVLQGGSAFPPPPAAPSPAVFCSPPPPPSTKTVDTIARQSGPPGPPVLNTAKPLELLHYLISIQSFAGSWIWDSTVVETTLGLPASALPEGLIASSTNAQRSEDWKMEEDIGMTVLVLRFLRKNTEMRDLEGVWELIAVKAESWLDSVIDTERRKELDEVTEGLF